MKIFKFIKIKKKDYSNFCFRFVGGNHSFVDHQTQKDPFEIKSS